MKGRITREHDARQGYDGVYFEGGSAVTDADLNAAFDAGRDLTETLHRAWIAPVGSPDDGWKVTGLRSFNNGGQDFVNFDVQPGHYGFDGAIAKNPDIYAFNNQPYALSAALGTDFQLPAPTVAEVLAAPDGELYDGVVLDVRKVAIQVPEDAELDEVAIRSDPATRTKFSPKVRAFRNVSSTCSAARTELLGRLANPNGSVDAPSPKISSNGRLRVQLGDVPNVDNPCAQELSTGYFGRLNRTIKVMLTEPGQFVWGYRNGIELHRTTMEDPTTLRILTPFDDSALFPVSGQIAEVCTWDMSLANGEKTAVPLGRFHAISTGYLPQTETLTLDTALDGDLQDWYNARLDAGEEPFLFVRFWEPPETVTVPMATFEPTGLMRPLAETGVFLDFVTAGKAGDLWTFSVRVNANDTIFPARMLEPGGQAPEGQERYADLLALIHWTVEGGEVVGHIHDCRRRVRPLWKQQGCCTFRVGDGETSFGDFDRIGDSIAALPHEGGKICVLPGRHTGGIDLLNRENVTIEGCGERSIIEPGEPDVPLLTVEDCTNVVLRDLLFLDETALAIAGAGNNRLELFGVKTRGRGSAISLPRTTRLRIKECSFFANAEPSIIPAADFPTLRPLAFVGGSEIEIRDTAFRCEASDLTLQSLGGLQIASNSSNIWIENNVIWGGIGNGLTLGHVTRTGSDGVAYGDIKLLQEIAAELGQAAEANAKWHSNGRTAQLTSAELLEVSTDPAAVAIVQQIMEDGQLTIDENPIAISVVAAQGCLGIDPTVPQPDPEDDDDEWDEYLVEGDITHVHMLDNEIGQMGGSGIATAAWNLTTRRPFGTMQVVDLTVARNHISSCAKVAIATTLPDDEIHEIGFGGIALEYAERAIFSGNVVEDIGLGLRTPSSAIYVRELVSDRQDIRGFELPPGATR